MNIKDMFLHSQPEGKEQTSYSDEWFLITSIWKTFVDAK